MTAEIPRRKASLPAERLRGEDCLAVFHTWLRVRLSRSMIGHILDEECIFMDPLQTTVPMYVSRKSGKNLWQDYSVYPDRVQLRCWAFLTTFVIRAEDIVEVQVSTGLLAWGLKLDFSDLFEHVILRRRTGLFKNLAFTPDNPEIFVAACKSIMRAT